MKVWLVSALVVASACQTNRTSQRAPGEPTMNDLMHRRTAARNTPGFVAPPDRVKGPPRDPTPAELAAAQSTNATADVYAIAIRYYTAGDKTRALATLDRAERAHPADDRWRYLRSSLYYQTLVGSRGPLPYNVVHTVSNEDANGKFASEIRRRLAESNDPELLIFVARYLAHSAMELQRRGLAFDPLALAKTYVEHARQVGADETRLNAASASIERASNYRVMTELTRNRRPEDALAQATPEQKVLLLEMMMRSASHRDEREKCATAARSLLELTSNSPASPNLLQVRVDAEQMLGKIALRNGDLNTAIRHMHAAAEKSFPQQRHSFELARALVDWGYRDAVATYLERIARDHRDAPKFTEWAALIRKGRNPDLIPYQTGCGKEPC